MPHMESDTWFVWVNPGNSSITFSARLSAITRIMEFKGRFPEVFTIGSDTGMQIHADVVAKLKARLGIPAGLSQ
jgi:hypothetical protein